MSTNFESTPQANPAPRSKPQRIADLVITIGFLVAITAPSAAMLVARNEGEIVTTEQRRAAPFPELTFRRIGPISWLKSYCLQKFPHSFECWYDDRVGFRRPLIRAYNLAKVFGLTVENRIALGEAAHGGVTVGRDGWLFLAGGKMEADFRRTDPFSTEGLACWRRYLTERRDRLAAANIGYACLAAPNQQTIYAEFMPRSMTRADRPSRLDQLAAETARDPKLPFIDLRSELTAGKRSFPTYHQTVTHWNDYGAFLAYERVMGELGKSLPGLRAVPLEAFDVRLEKVVNFGDMSRALNAPIDYEQILVTLEPRSPRRAVCETLRDVPGEEIRKTTNYEVPSGRLLVFHDSFMDSVRPYLSEHFREVYYYRRFSAAAIVEHRPDFVLEEFAERHLMGPIPTNPPELQRPLSDDAAHGFARDPRTTKQR